MGASSKLERRMLDVNRFTLHRSPLSYTVNRYIRDG